MNPNDPLHQQKLATAIEHSYRGLEWLRNLKRGLVEAYAGSGYGKATKPRRETIVNLAMQTVDAYTMALVANRPRILATSSRPEYFGFAKRFTVAVNNYIEEIGLEFTLRNWVLDAFFGLGVVKVHLADSGMVQLEHDRWADPGKPFASNLPTDNFVFDMAATRYESVRFAGDSYRIPFSDLDHPMFLPEVVQDLVPSKNGDDDERTEKMSRGNDVQGDDFEEMIDLADIWIPRDGKIYTFPIDNRGQFQIKGKPVAVMDWEGTERGPYHLLGFNDVPDNIVPTSMLAQLAAQERLINNILRKQGRQAMRHKDITAFPADAKADAERIQRADDGAVVNVNSPELIKQIQFGGMNPVNQAFAVSMMQTYDRLAGNLTGMLGLGAQAPTASQEQMIQSRISSKGASMQYRVLDATSRLITDLGFMLWNDKAKIVPGRIPIDGAEGYSIDATLMPGDREGEFWDYDLQVDVFSMAYSPPEERWAKIMGYITNVYAPQAAQFAAQGIQLNLQELTNLAAEFMNVPQLKQCLQAAAPTPLEEEAAPGPANTTRSYERRSVSAGPTPQNAANQQMQQWMSMDSARTGGMRGNPV